MNDHPSSAPFDLDQALARIMDRAKRLLPFDSGGIAIFDAETQLLAPRNYRRSTPDAPTPHLIKLGEGVAGLVAQTRQPMLVNDVSQDERYVPYDSQTCAELAVPILANDDLLGVFTVGCNQSDRYTDQHLLMLSALADHAALALVTPYQSLNQSSR